MFFVFDNSFGVEDKLGKLEVEVRTIDLSKIDLALSIWLRVLLAKEIRCKNYTLMV
jgi:hypothetical protein